MKESPSSKQEISEIYYSLPLEPRVFEDPGGEFEDINDTHVANIINILKGIDDSWLTEDDLSHLDYALQEIVVNAIKYGNKQDPKKPIRIELYMDKDELRASVTDQGDKLFDRSLVPDPTTPDRKLEPYGRGLFTIEALLGNDNVKYDFLGAENDEGDGHEKIKGNRVTLIIKNEKRERASQE